jgi:molybdenum cofactor cytidylyltransferase
MKVTGILLAAGSSRRYGSDKRLQQLDNGKTLLSHSADALQSAVDDLLIVLAPGDETLAASLASETTKCCFNPQALNGMGSSISQGVQSSPDADAWLIMPVDLPLIRRETIHSVISALTPGRAVVPVCHGTRGHPVAFSRDFASELSALNGDIGGREILNRHSSEVTWLNVHDPGIHLDLDRREDLQSRLRSISTDASNATRVN